MTIGISSSSSALFSNRQISIREAESRTGFQRLGSGRRINNASDDAASLSISSLLSNSIKSGAVAARNISDGVSVGSIAEGALSTTSEITGRLSELAAQASNGVLNDSQRQILNQEYQALRSEIDRTVATTQFNGQNIFGNSATIQAGTDGSTESHINLSLGELSARALGLTSDISTQAGAQQSLDQANQAVAQVSSAQAEIGSTLEVLQTAFAQLLASSLPKEEANSKLQDADIAAESSKLAASNIGLSSATAIAAQANFDPQVALQLLS